jgi:hypothetical protein
MPGNIEIILEIAVNDAQAGEDKQPAESIIEPKRNIEAAITNSKIETKEINDQYTNHSETTKHPVHSRCSLSSIARNSSPFNHSKHHETSMRTRILDIDQSIPKREEK